MYSKDKINRLYKLRYYFMLGHSQYLILFMWFFQFSIIIQFGLGIDLILVYSLIIVLYIPLGILIGFIHIKTNFQEEQKIIQEESPLYKEIFSLLKKIEKRLE